MGFAAYRNVLRETEALFDYQLRQMALSLRDQGEIAPAQAGALADADFDFVVQIWTVDGRAIYASRAHTELPARAVLGFADVAAVQDKTWRTFSVATPGPRDPGRAAGADPPAPRGRGGAAQRAAAARRRAADGGGRVVAGGAGASGRCSASPAACARATPTRSRRCRCASLPDEVTPLVQALNALLQRLATAFGAQRAFVADAAHELRSPLTALAAADRAAAPLARRCRACRGARRAVGRRRARGAAGRAVADARAQRAGQAGGRPARRSTSANWCARRWPTPCRSRFRAAPSSSSTPTTACRSRANARRWPRWRATWPTTRCATRRPARACRCGSAWSDGAPTLWVDDAGPGIPAAEREHVFDRFYRREAAGDGEARAGQRARPGDRQQRRRAAWRQRDAGRLAARRAARRRALCVCAVNARARSATRASRGAGSCARPASSAGAPSTTDRGGARRVFRAPAL